MVCKMPVLRRAVCRARTQFQGVEFDLWNVGRGHLQRYLL